LLVLLSLHIPIIYLMIGWVEDQLIDIEQNKVEKIIISTGHLLSTGPMMALPYRSVGFSGYGLVYDISLSDLKNMPNYSPE